MMAVEKSQGWSYNHASDTLFLASTGHYDYLSIECEKD